MKPSIQIESGINLPGMRRAIKQAILSLQDGQSFKVKTRYELNQALLMGKQIGKPVTSRKLEDGGWRIWRKDAK